MQRAASFGRRFRATMATNYRTHTMQHTKVSSADAPLPEAWTQSPSPAGRAPEGSSSKDGAPHRPPDRVLTYRRVSGQEQDKTGTSPERQDEQLDAYVGAVGARERLDFFEVESGTRRGEPRRVEVAKLLRAVRPGDVVVCADLDRFTRNLSFAVDKVREIVAGGARFISLREGEFDGTPAGEFKLAVYAAVAQLEHARILDRTQGNRQRLRSLGKWVEGSPPYGYRRAKGRPGEDKPRTLEIDEAAAPVVVAAFQLCIKGHSVDKISAYLIDKFEGRTFNHTWVLHALKNRVYLGQVSLTPYRPRTHEATDPLPVEWVNAHPPIISRDIFDQVQAALAGRRGKGPKPYQASGTAGWLLRGMAYCGICGALCGSAPAHKTSRHKVAGYYVCRHRTHPKRHQQRCTEAPYMRQPDGDTLIDREVKKRLAALPALLGQLPKTRGKVRDFETERKALIESRQRLVTLVKGKDSPFSVQDIMDAGREINNKLSVLAVDEREQAAEAGADTVDNRKAARTFVEGVAKRWDGFDAADRRLVIRTLVAKIVIRSTDTLDVEWKDSSALTADITAAGADIARLLTEPV
jgi:DNA invertase Pin-like site-specific DNA recombinase